MATVLETYDWETDGLQAALQAWVGSADSEAVQLEEDYAEALATCHEILDERDFVDADGVSEPAPLRIQSGLRWYVKVLRDRKRRGDGVLETKTATRSLKFDTTATGDAALRAALPYWRRYVLDATRLGSMLDA